MDQTSTMKHLIAEGRRLRADAGTHVGTRHHHDYCARVRAWFDACRVTMARVSIAEAAPNGVTPREMPGETPGETP